MLFDFAGVHSVRCLCIEVAFGCLVFVWLFDACCFDLPFLVVGYTGNSVAFCVLSFVVLY